MKKRQIKNNVNLYFLENDAYKTNRITINFYSELNQQNAGLGAILTKLLIRANKNIQTTLELERELNKLYGASMLSGYGKFGDIICYSFGLYILKNKFAGEGIEEKALKILTDCVLFQTDFDEEYFFQEKENQINTIHAKANDKKALALNNLIKLLANDEPFAVSEDGEIDDVAEVELEDVIDFYDYKFLKLPCDIICSGEFDEEKLANRIANLFKHYDADADLPKSSTHEFGEEKALTESEELSQSKLAIGFSLGAGTDEEKTVFNAIFGATPYSKLFMNVREKMSLCYYVSSKMDLFKNILVVESGINKQDFEKAKMGIGKQLEEVIAGNFDEKDIDDAKRAILQSIKQAKASLPMREQLFVKERLLGRELNEELLGNVSKEAIMAVAKDCKHEAVYLLESQE